MADSVLLPQELHVPAAAPADAPATIAPATGRSTDRLLCADDLARYRDAGYLHLAGVCTGAELAQLRTLLVGLFERATGYDEGNLFDMVGADGCGRDARQPQLLNPSVYAPQLLRSALYDRLHRLASQLLGEPACFSFDHSIVKRAGSLAATPWHQDEAHHQDPDLEFDQVSFWMPLQDVAEHNGCMVYLPGSQRGSVLPHRSPGGDTRLHTLECLLSDADLQSAQVLPMRAGACVLHGGRTLHSALPNPSGTDRLAYVLVFRGALRPRAEPVRHAWLADQHTADAARKRHWLRRGGYLVQLARRLRRLATLHRLGAFMRRYRPAPR
jgi:Phytanoyl-CoA dioxygenase (PhyH)